MRTFLSILLILAIANSARAQSSPAERAISQQSGSDSETYTETLAMVKSWHETEESDELGRLFAIGDLRTRGLLRICHNTDEEIAALAFITLHLLGKPECVPFGETTSRKHNDVPLVCGAKLVDADFKRIDRWSAKKKIGSRYECAPEGEYEPLTPLPDSVVYALILDGSPRSKLILNTMLVIEKACVTEGATIIGEALNQAPSLMVAAKRERHLQFEADKLEGAVRSSAFFLPSEYREDS